MSAAAAGRDWRNCRVFTSFPLVTFFADDEAEAERMLFALEDAINATPGVQTCLDEECYEVRDDEHDAQWRPMRETGDKTPTSTTSGSAATESALSPTNEDS